MAYLSAVESSRRVSTSERLERARGVRRDKPTVVGEGSFKRGQRVAIL